MRPQFPCPEGAAWVSEGFVPGCLGAAISVHYTLQPFLLMNTFTLVMTPGRTPVASRRSQYTGFNYGFGVCLLHSSLSKFPGRLCLSPRQHICCHIPAYVLSSLL
eukprot:8663547-Lingulodinium_polyedra.AAC.1